MREGSQTTAVDTATITKCPEWCTSTDKEHRDDFGEWYHYGPEFGSIWTRADDEGAPLAFPRIGHDEVDAEQLRKIAADCLAAAEWLEAQR